MQDPESFNEVLHQRALGPRAPIPQWGSSQAWRCKAESACRAQVGCGLLGPYPACVSMRGRRSARWTRTPLYVRGLTLPGRPRLLQHLDQRGDQRLLVRVQHPHAGAQLP